mmetsp:Transcript_133449/g.414994  ORF Transcript_133449/g.414994 Transcript_133449/m.414994 type:complete len:431 (-) Transcript_133449:966-2258(-)
MVPLQGLQADGHLRLTGHGYDHIGEAGSRDIHVVRPSLRRHGPRHLAVEDLAVGGHDGPEHGVLTGDLQHRLGLQDRQLALLLGCGRADVNPLAPQRRLAEPCALAHLRGDLLQRRRGVRPLGVLEDAGQHEVGRVGSRAGDEEVVAWMHNCKFQAVTAQLPHAVLVHGQPQAQQGVIADGRQEGLIAQLHEEAAGEVLEGGHLPVAASRVPIPPLLQQAVRDLLLHEHASGGGDVVALQVLAQGLHLLVLVLVGHGEVHQRGGERRDQRAAQEEANEHADDVDGSLEGVAALHICGAQRYLGCCPVESRHVVIEMVVVQLGPPRLRPVWIVEHVRPVHVRVRGAMLANGIPEAGDGVGDQRDAKYHGEGLDDYAVVAEKVLLQGLAQDVRNAQHAHDTHNLEKPHDLHEANYSDAAGPRGLGVHHHLQD